MKTFGLAVMLLTLLLSAGTASAQPLPPPLSPEAARLVEEFPALRDARVSGAGIVIAGVNQFGCAVNAMKLNLAIIVDKPGTNYVIRTTVTSGINSISKYMNQRVVFGFVSGWYLWTIGDSVTGGTVNSSFPMPSATPLRVQILLSQPNGKPLWYSELTINDCDGTPSTTSGSLSTPVRILNKNPTFQPDSANPGRAAKWTPTGKVSYSCAAGVCTEKLTGKAGKVARLKQGAKVSPPTAADSAIGMTVVLDMAGTTGMARLDVTPQLQNSPLLWYFFPIMSPGTDLAATEVAQLPFGSIPSEMDKVVIDLYFSDYTTGDPVASGKLKIKAVYVYSVQF